MPRFTKVHEAFLKKTMLPRVPECFFTPEDVALITKETGFDADTIQNWAKCLRWRMKNNRGISSVEDYLKASEEALAAQVVSYEIIETWAINSMLG